MYWNFFAIASAGILALFGAAVSRHWSGGGSHGGFSAPEIDGPASITALALLVSVGLIAYNRMRRR